MKFKVSIIIPVYLGERYLDATLRSALGQTYRNTEVLCIDDHSPDGSAAIINDWQKRDRRVRYLQTPRNLGLVPKVMNFAAAHATGDLFVYASQDDHFSPDWISSMVNVRARTGAEVVVPDLEHRRIPASSSQMLCNSWRDPVSGVEAFRLSLDWSIPGNALWPISYLKDVGYEDFGMYADEYTARKFYLMSDMVAFAKGTFHYFHGNPQAITKKVSPKFLDAPYNEWRLWELVEQTFPGSEESAVYADRAFRSLLEATVRMQRSSALRKEQWRLRTALRAMESATFQLALANRYRAPIMGRITRLVIKGKSIREIVAAAIRAQRFARRIPSLLPGAAEKSA